MATEKWKNFTLLTLSGLIVCVIIGFITAGTNAFLPGKFAFQFTLYGLFGSLFYAVLKFSTTRDFIFITILLILFDIILLGGGTISKTIIHGLYAVLYAGAIYIFIHYIQQDKTVFNLSHVFSLSGIVATAFLLIVLLLSVFPNYPFKYSFLESQTFIGLLIGLGLGIGFKIYYKFST